MRGVFGRYLLIGVIGVLGVTLGVVLLRDYRSWRNYQARLSANVRTRLILLSLSSDIVSCEMRSEQYSPVVPEQLAPWLLKHRREVGVPRYLSEDSQQLVDDWGQPIELVVSQGKVVAVKSTVPPRYECEPAVSEIVELLSRPVPLKRGVLFD